jgi:hypothetical protein
MLVSSHTLVSRGRENQVLVARDRRTPVISAYVFLVKTQTHALPRCRGPTILRMAMCQGIETPLHLICLEENKPIPATNGENSVSSRSSLCRTPRRQENMAFVRNTVYD